MTRDLERAYKTIEAEKRYYQLYWEYYDGAQRLVYSENRLEEVFGKSNARFNQNLCAMVIDSVLDRLEMSGFDAEDKTVKTRIDEMWNKNFMHLDTYDVHEAVGVCGEAFVIVDREGEQPVIYNNDPRLCHMFYKSDKPKVKDYAAKMWRDEETNKHKMTLYYPDRIEYYISSGDKEPTNAAAFVPDDPASVVNEDGAIPVFHYRLNRRRVKSLLNDVITLQDAVNKLFVDEMVASEFASIPQRWAIANVDTKTIVSRAGGFLIIPPSEDGASVGQFPTADLSQFNETIDNWVNAVSVITHVPKHYLMSAGSNISGDALIVMESPLVKKVKKIQEILSVTWRELAVYLLMISGVDVDISDINVVWEKVETVQPLAEAQARQISTQTGIPLVTELKREGWSEEEIGGMLQDQEEARTTNTSVGQALLERLRVEQEQRNDEGDVHEAGI